MEKTSLSKRGKSLWLKIPSKIIQELNLTEKSELFVAVKGTDLLIHKELSLEEMLETITDENRQELIDFGPPVGRELI